MERAAAQDLAVQLMWFQMLLATVVDGSSIRQVSPAGVVKTIAGCPSGGCTDSVGDADGPGETARFGFTTGIARDNAGNLYVADAGNETVRKLTFTDGDWMVTTLAGLTGQASVADGIGSDARFDYPTGIAVDAAGAVYVVNSNENGISKGLPASAPAPFVQFDTSAGGLMLGGGNIQMRINSSSSGILVLEASTNLQTWIPIQTNVLSGGSVNLSIPITQDSHDFFRAVLTP
jgi:hypothetical protein